MEKVKGFKALSPLLVFLAVYLVSSILAHDFYKVPVSSAFLISTVYAVLMGSRKGIDEKIRTFSQGAGHPDTMLMIWIFVMAGVFANTAKEIGSVEATVNLTLSLLPGKLLLAGLFLASCFISMAIGTSVGTIVALVPIAAALAEETSLAKPLLTAVVVGGAFFGDNLSFISDTTIAATKTQGCKMSDKFKANLKIAASAAICTTVIYLILGRNVSALPQAESIEWIKILPYLLVIGLALKGMNVLVSLALASALNAVLGFFYGNFNWVGFLESAGKGIAGMGDLILVTMLASGLLALIKSEGGLDYIINILSNRIKGKRSAYFSIAWLVSLVNICTANNTVAIITTGSIASDISRKFSLSPVKVASILDTFSCVIQGLLPYGAQVLMASGLAGVSSALIISNLYYPMILFVTASGAIMLNYRKN